MLAIQRVMDARGYSRHLVKTFSAINATAGTGLAEAVKTAFAATAAMAVMRNGAAAGLVRPKYLRLVNTVAPASGTAMHMRLALDTGVTRVSSGGTALTARNRDMSSSVASNVTLTFGAVVTAAATASVRYVSQLTPSTVIPIVGEEFLFTFDAEHNGQHAISGGTVARKNTFNVAPIVLGPSQELIVHAWYPSNATTPASWEVEACWEESRK